MLIPTSLRLQQGPCHVSTAKSEVMIEEKDENTKAIFIANESRMREQMALHTHNENDRKSGLCIYMRLLSCMKHLGIIS